jgi:type II secretory pathway component PulC
LNITIPEISNDTFYGFRLNPATGQLLVEVISEGDGVVQLPDGDMIDPYDYRQWIWTKLDLSFSFKTNGHLEAKISCK